jgi:peptidoglycan LD-endopeptidase LytH
MNRKRPHRGRLIPVLFFTFVAGMATGWWARPSTSALLSRVERVEATRPETGTGGDVRLEPPPRRRDPVDRLDTPLPAGAAAERAVEAQSASGPDDDALPPRPLRLPVDDADVRAMQGQFGDRRDRGSRGHEAVDILAPRNTPVHAVDDGTVAKLFFSKQGGITVYQFDATERFCYYYAHLERYAPGLRERQKVSRGDVIGYVGTTGNAPANTPHLHFAIFRLTPERRWWQGTPVDPWAAFSR